MSDTSHDLHGNAPDSATVALLIIDMINDLEFEGAERMAADAVRAARNTRALKDRCGALGILSLIHI